MVTLEQWVAFAIAALIVTVAPGPDNLATLSIGLSRGRQAAVGFGLGCGLGCLSHTTWAVLGVSAVLAASAAAFTTLKVAGAAYLFWLGVKALQSRGPALHPAPEQANTSRYFIRGLVANAINPKVALFFLAFLPQFVRADQPVGMQLAVLGITFTVLAVIVFAMLGYFSGRLGNWLRARAGVGRWLDRLTGCLFIGLGIRLVLARR